MTATTPTISPDTIATGRRSQRIPLGWEMLTTAGIFLALAVVDLVLQPGLADLFQIGLLLQVALPAVLIASAQTLVALIRGIDLSVGGMFVVTNALTATWANHALGGGWTALAVVLLVGAGLGLVNGLLVTVLRLQPFIATLGTWTIFNGIALTILKTDGGAPSTALLNASLTEPLGIPLPIVMLVALLGAWRLLRGSRFGTQMIAVGSDEERARLNGTSVRMIKAVVYSLAGLLCAVAGIYAVGVTSTGTPTGGDAYILTSVAAVVIGGTSLAGGKGGIGLTVMAALSLTIISDIVAAMNLGAWVAVAASSGLLLVVVVLRSVVELMSQRRTV